MGLKYCPKCGRRFLTESFCPDCGEKIVGGRRVASSADDGGAGEGE